jgi:hypothetical protein
MRHLAAQVVEAETLPFQLLVLPDCQVRATQAEQVLTQEPIVPEAVVEELEEPAETRALPQEVLEVLVQLHP